ncbi:MAG: SH3 domain-containing protein [bacterium]
MNHACRKWVTMCSLLLAMHAVQAASPATMSVQVKAGQLRVSPSYLGKVTGDLAYGDQVTILKEQGEWMQVQTQTGQTGWMHLSALSKKKIVLSSGTTTAQTSTSGEEMALAGKGFNSDVEAQFKSQNKDIDFTWIDKMEKIKVDPQEAVIFLKEGGLQ